MQKADFQGGKAVNNTVVWLNTCEEQLGVMYIIVLWV